MLHFPACTFAGESPGPRRAQLKRTMKPRRILALSAFTAAALSTAEVGAVVIDFESLPVGALAGPVGVPGNSVTFGVGAGTAPPPSGPAYIADVGAPTTAFAPGDTPAAAVAGRRFLTDEPNGPNAALNYFMSFANPISDLSLHLYDYRVDGGPAAGDSATLTVYDAAWSPVGSSTFVIPTINPVDGNVETLSVLSPTGDISFATVTFSTPDVGTGIDNITFSNVPDASHSLMLFGIALSGLVGVRRFARKSRR